MARHMDRFRVPRRLLGRSPREPSRVLPPSRVRATGVCRSHPGERAMAVSFRVNVRWPDNDLMFPADWYGVQVPPGLDTSYVRVPKYIGVVEMQNKQTTSDTATSSSK